MENFNVETHLRGQMNELDIAEDICDNVCEFRRMDEKWHPGPEDESNYLDKDINSLDECIDEILTLASLRSPPNKKRIISHVAPILFGRLRTEHGEDPKPTLLRILLDSGAWSEGN